MAVALLRDPCRSARQPPRDHARTLNALGTVTPLATVTVRPQVNGTIVKFNFQEGQTVKAGDVLAEIDPRPLPGRRRSGRGASSTATAHRLPTPSSTCTAISRWRRAEAPSRRRRTCHASRPGEAGSGVVTVDEGNLATANLNLKYAKVTSPVTGRAGMRQVDIGNLVQAGQANGIVVVTQIAADVGGVHLAGRRYRASAETRNCTAARSLPSRLMTGQSRVIAQGTLSAVDSEIDTTTGTVKLRAMFDNSDNALFPNQFVNVRLLVNTLARPALVPTPAIQRGAGGSYVFVVSPDKTVRMRGVTTGATDGTATMSPFVKGLQPGDTVVVDGADRLRDGDEVTIPKGPWVASPIPAPRLPVRALPVPRRQSPPRALRGHHQAILRRRHAESTARR